ncbi:uncharacterized protein LOC119614126 [Lucilia sericata]|uniref:uncharacterized protein LOC119614126 n=1 Tax=Lucilia sericata TaxID=13632 RepID=UPI0018A8825F|nr:uncharacterized protein LOC119614126 [Lucilia sericata]
MAVTKIYIFVVTLILAICSAQATENSTANTANESSTEVISWSTLQFSVFICHIFEPLDYKYINKSNNIAQELLKDEIFVNNTESEILEFKQNLTNYIEYYEARHGYKDICDIFNNTNWFYREILNQELTKESIFMKELLDKYNYNELEMEFLEDFEDFVNDLKKQFEENKMELEKPMRRWYEKFLGLNEFDEKFKALKKFFDFDLK